MHAKRAPFDDLGIFALISRALSLRPIDHDGFERSDAAPNSTAAQAPPPRRRLLDRVDHWFWKRDQRALEAHLGKASDVFDLEARIRDLERGVPYRYN